MTYDRTFGDAVPRSFKLESPPKLLTRSLRQSQIAISRLSIGSAQLGMSPRIPPEDTFILAHYLTPVRHHELWSRGRSIISGGYERNAMRIVNLVGEFSANVSEPHETVAYYIPRAAVNEYADDVGSRSISNIYCEPGVVDPVVTHLTEALLPSFEKSSPATTFFVDHVALAVLAHLVQRYGGLANSGAGLVGGLSTSQTNRAMDFLSTHAAEDISLLDIARACDLSRSYFIKAFKTTTGLTPHQWLQRRRIDMAKQMMLDSDCPIAEIAAACGFADQSHLTRVFLRIVGGRPAAWRRERRSLTSAVRRMK